MAVPHGMQDLVFLNQGSNLCCLRSLKPPPLDQKGIPLQTILNLQTNSVLGFHVLAVSFTINQLAVIETLGEYES